MKETKVNGKVFLFSAETDATSLINGAEANIQVNCSEHMTVEEMEQFKDAMRTAISCVQNALLRSINE